MSKAQRKFDFSVHHRFKIDKFWIIWFIKKNEQYLSGTNTKWSAR